MANRSGQPKPCGICRVNKGRHESTGHEYIDYMVLAGLRHSDYKRWRELKSFPVYDCAGKCGKWETDFEGILAHEERCEDAARVYIKEAAHA